MEVRMLSEKTIGRLSLYRRLLSKFQSQNIKHVYSHELASIAHGTATQVRRDLMMIAFSGSPSKGYNVEDLMRQIDCVLDAPEGQKIALVGIGNLGRAIISYFAGRRPNLSIVAAFDKDPHKIDRLIHGCPCYPHEKISEVVKSQRISMAIITVPAEEAQTVADTLVHSGVQGILNFAPVPLRVPSQVYIEDIDVTMLLEKVAYFARTSALSKE
jgi:redox-sensing transcriptional repressor